MKWIFAPAGVLLLGLAACNSDKTANPNPQANSTQLIVAAADPNLSLSAAPAASTLTSPGAGTSASDIPALTPLDYLTLEQPIDGDHALRVVSPNVLELTRLSTKRPDPAPMDVWNFGDANGNVSLPGAGQFAVVVNGQAAVVQA